jgi:hypothetical protein
MPKIKFLQHLFVLIILISAVQLQAQNSVKPKFSTPNIYAGIEVGSKGIKMSILELKRNPETGNTYQVLKDTTVNTDFISFTQATFDATLNGLSSLFNSALTSFQIPSKRIFTVISSGVKIQADKDSKQDWIQNLIKSFKEKINEPQRKVEIVSVMDEARLSHLGIVPEKRRFNTFLIDIGSGNTKGGLFPYGNINDFYLFQLTWGTKSTTNAAEKMCGDDKSFTNFNKQLMKVAAGAENSEIIYNVNLSGSYPVSDYIAFSGGIAWATATLIYPELNNNPIVPVTYEEVERFAKRLAENYASLSPESLTSKITDEKWDKAVITKEIKRVQQVFDQRSLMGGTALLLRIMRQFKSVSETKQFYLIKNGSVGWISAYVNNAVE